MTKDSDLDRPFDTDKTIEKTWDQANLGDPEEEEIDPDDELEDEITDDLDDADQLDESDADKQYRGSPRGPSPDAVD